ncbi:MAG TPA: hypothetical protein ENK68_04360 [Epsilonproteobacteria bacterium]|nr:hypothetical protein [Campylobacterota bacterium]
MKWKTTLSIATLILFMVGCDNSNMENNTETIVPSSEIKKLQIIQDDGNVFSSTERFTDYSYDFNEIPSEVLEKIDTISTTSENLYCSNDGQTFQINITDNSDIIHTYVSNNRDCGRENETNFISIDDIEEIITLLD